MRFSSILTAAAIVLMPALLNAQDQDLQLRDVWASGSLLPERFSSVTHLADGKHFTRLKSNRSRQSQFILRYSYEEAEPLDTLFKSTELASIDDYSFSASERYLLLKTQTQPIYRYSTRAVFYIYDREEDRMTPVHNEEYLMYATLSPDEERVAYVHDNDLYIQPIDGEEPEAVTTDGEKNRILNGRSDWVYEEELNLVKAFEWAPDGKRLAYYRFNESALPTFSLKKYADSNYPARYTYKYPKVGEPNSEVSLHTYHVTKRETTTIQTEPKNWEYLPRIQWTKDPEMLSYQTLNRNQNDLKLYFADATTGEARQVHQKTSDTYVEVNDMLTFLPDNAFIWNSEKSGFNHLYHYNADGELVNRITEGNWEVAGFMGYDEADEQVYFQAAKPTPMQRQVYRIGLNGENRKQLSSEEGTHSVEFSADYSYAIMTSSAANEPPQTTILNAEREKVRQPIENQALKERMGKYNFSDQTFFQFETRDGTQLNGYMVKPPDFDESREYPVLMRCYGGPGIQTVKNEWGYYDYTYNQLLAQKGYIVVSVDNRGTGARGREFQKMTYQNLGHYETIDQIAGANYLAKQPYVDSTRIGIFGWSYGGYLSLLSLAKGSEAFQTGVAVAPVTDWRFYDNIYTERYMRRPSVNEEGYEQSSVLNYADEFEDHFLLVHGMYDDNVHPQHSMELMRRLINRNHAFDSEVYPNKTHSISGGFTRYHLFNRITQYLDNHLKSPESAKAQ